jgi:hypothetical protein
MSSAESTAVHPNPGTSLIAASSAIGTRGPASLRGIGLGRLSVSSTPEQDSWNDRFRLNDAVIEPLTDIGEITARLLRFNAAERVVERRLLQSLGRYPR